MKYRSTAFVLAISPSPRGFAFVLFQGPSSPFDWGVKEVRGGEKNARTVAAIKKLIDGYRPETLVIEEPEGSRRGPRIRVLHRSIIQLASTEKITLVRYTRLQIRKTFASENARSKSEIAKAIATRIPAFAPRVPPARKIWMSEDPRQSLFDAAALAITHYASSPRAERDAPPHSVS